MWKLIRTSILLLVLVIVAANAWLEQRRAADWRDSQYVGIFPVAADGTATTRAYVASLQRNAFVPIEGFFAREARRHGLALAAPFRIELYPQVTSLPPEPPAGGRPLASLWWSMRMRFYAASQGSVGARPPPHVRVFVLYHDPALNPRLPHSASLRKGQIGLVHAFASAPMNDGNDVVIAHELLHTVGATDKYDTATDAPLYPQGFADPEQRPPYPQRLTEIMAGRRPLTPSTQEMPASLDDCVVGEATAAEVHWPPPR